jgi:hypothetical protein
LDLLSANHAFDGIHGDEVVPVASAPLMGIHITILKNLLHFGVRFQVDFEQQVKPFFDEFAVFFSSDKIVFIG